MASTTSLIRSLLRNTTSSSGRTTTTASQCGLLTSRSRAGGPARTGQQAHYSPLPVRRPSKARKNRKKAPRPPCELHQPPTWPSLWSSTHPFPWTEYDSSDVSRGATTDVATTREAGRRSEDQGAVLGPDHPATRLLSESALVVVRQLEMLNLFVGFEQANRYRILNPAGHTLGFLLEEQRAPWTGALQRQLLRSHRPLHAALLDPHGQPILLFRRPFTLLSSNISVLDPRSSSSHHPPRVVGESRQDLHLWRRRYNLFSCAPSSPNTSLHFHQFARIDAGFLAWHFPALDHRARNAASISKDFTGLARELFTDTGQYVVRFFPHNSAPLSPDQRAVILATAISIDFDYFSHSHGGGLMPPIFFGGGSSSDGDF